MAKETAEQKLLKLIESTDKEQKPVQSAPASSEAQKVFDAVRGSAPAAIKVPSGISSLLSVFQNPAALAQRTSSMGLKDLNRLMAVLIVIVVIIFITDFMRGLNMAKIEMQFGSDQQEMVIPDNFLPSFKDVSEYLASVSERNIFQPYDRKMAKEKDVPPEFFGYERVVEQAKDLKLVGISWLDTPESASALIENTSNGMTYFLKKGERIQNVTIQAIYADSITVSFDGQEMEMRL